MFRLTPLKQLLLLGTLPGLSAAVQAAPIVVIDATTNDGNFEAGAPNGFPNYRTGVVGGWTYSGGTSGLTNNAQGDFVSNGNATNYGFVQHTPGNTGSSISQSFFLNDDSSLFLSYEYGGRNMGGESYTIFQALLDGVAISSVNTVTTQPFTGTNASVGFVAAGLHTLTFRVLQGFIVADNTALLDNVVLLAEAVPELNGTAASVPLSLALSGLVLLSSRRRRTA